MEPRKWPQAKKLPSSATATSRMLPQSLPATMIDTAVSEAPLLSADHAWAAGTRAVAPTTTKIAVTARTLVTRELIRTANRPLAVAKTLVRS